MLIRVITKIVLLTFLFCIGVQSATAQGLTQTPTSSPSSTAMPSSGNLSYQEALDYYLSLSTEVVKTSNTTLDLAKWMVGLVGVFASIATSVITYVGVQARHSRIAAQSSARNAKASLKKAEELDSKIQGNLTELDARKSEIKDIELELAHHISNLVQAETLMTLKKYLIQCHSENSTSSAIALAAIIEYSRDDDPVIRFEALGILKRFLEFTPSSDQRITALNRIRTVARDDNESLLQLEANNILASIETNGS